MVFWNSLTTRNIRLIRCAKHSRIRFFGNILIQNSGFNRKRIFQIMHWSVYYFNLIKTMCNGFRWYYFWFKKRFLLKKPMKFIIKHFSLSFQISNIGVIIKKKSTQLKCSQIIMISIFLYKCAEF